jgi:hypothetical protein
MLSSTFQSSLGEGLTLFSVFGDFFRGELFDAYEFGV